MDGDSKVFGNMRFVAQRVFQRGFRSFTMEDRFAAFADASKYQIIKEGAATVVTEIKGEKKAAFYNNAQVINRDLSVAMVQWYVDKAKSEGGESDVTYLEALAASGLRSIRMAKEVKGLRKIVANDMEPSAVEQMRRNVALNDVQEGEGFEVKCSDAVDLMYAHRKDDKRFHIVDLDPYGAPSIFLDGAVQSVRDGGLLQVTATDLMNLCGNSPDVCFRKYGAVPIKSRFCHEMAIRILLASIALKAQFYGRHIEPLVSLMIDFYVRVFVRVGTSGAEAQRNVSQIGHVWQCPSCHYHVTQPLATRHKNNDQKYLVSNGTPVPQNCPFCAAHFKMAGPMWLGPLHDVGVVTDLMGAVETRKFASEKKLLGILSVASEELNDVPLFYNLSDLCNVLRSTLPSMHTFKSALINAGYRVSGIHTEPFGFKTDAPMEVIWDVLRCWKKKSGQGKPPKETTPAFRILNVEPKLEADFTLVEEAKTSKKRPRFVKVDGWGPQKRAVTGGAVANTKKSKTKEEEEAAESEKNNNNNNNNGDNEDADNKVKKSD